MDKDVNEYIEGLPDGVRQTAEEIRSLILEIAPGATEKISYGMPAFHLNGRPLVYFAVFKKHIGFYPTPNGTDAFEEELSLYKHGKGSVQFPLDKPVPFDLIRRITVYRAKENAEFE